LVPRAGPRRYQPRGKELWGMSGEADLFADVEHGRFVALAFPDDDGAVHLHLIHGLAHGFDGHFNRLCGHHQSPWWRAEAIAAFSTTRRNSRPELFFHAERPPRRLMLGKVMLMVERRRGGRTNRSSFTRSRTKKSGNYGSGSGGRERLNGDVEKIGVGEFGLIAGAFSGDREQGVRRAACSI